jgi:surface antigen
MKTIRSLPLLSLFIVVGCATPAPFHHEYASGHYSSQIEQCALYARRVSGIRLYGDAGGWWSQAKGRYKRGHRPAPGSVLVLKSTSRMHSGHVAVVKKVLGPRKITVTHSNWGDSSRSRHIVYDSMLAEDVSPANDWSQVRFWNDAKNVMGFPYAAYGFIYP